MSIAPPPAYPTWPPQPYPPAQQKPRWRWPAVAAAAGVGAIVAGLVTTLITYAATSPEPAHTTAPAPSTVTETAAPPPSPAPLPVAEADAQTCRAWRNTDTLFTAAAAAQGVIPQGMTITDPAVQTNPAWKAGVLRASDLYAQAANTFASQIATGTRPMLAQVADTTVSSLRTLAEAYKSFDPISGNAVPVYQANQKALDWLCQ
ncbi:hypothetical protein HZU40_00170 (plasmid) [Mycolicibacterium fluoranthenivorans]|uniref:Alanine and proline rich membrane protein n=1 Tax=Mycolicibacterium fluoranthenivorans TaxID=258505 RepID=A0A7G8P6F4_9MYCO|nr:hypothetical protein [Mycolicibacterium fluoranthenivorans]QNJ89920.1 hypothetical protein HZU40_00170 [Mycolicibacterium fluoranthenivorans]